MFYDRLKEDNFKRLYIPKRVHNKLFPNRKVKFFETVEYYIKDDVLIFNKFTNLFGVILLLVLFPIFAIIHGFGNKSLYNDYKKLLNQKKYGSYTSDHVYKSRSPEIFKTMEQYQ